MRDSAGILIIGGGMTFTFGSVEKQKSETSLYDEEGAEIVQEIMVKAVP